MSLNNLAHLTARARHDGPGRRFAGVTLGAALVLAGGVAFRAVSSVADGAAGASIFYSSEQRGHLEPCGCSKPQIGGLARRATFLRRLPPEVASLQIDNGDLVDTVGRQSELKSEALAEFFKSTHYAAVNLGEKDYALGFGYLRYLQSLSGVPFVSGNVVRGEGKPLFETHVVRRMKVNGEEVAVAIVGLISPSFQTEIAQWNPGFAVTPPQETLASIKPQIEGTAKLIVLLFHGEPQEARELAKAHPWLDAIITAHEAEDYRARAEREGKTILVNTGQRGKYLGKLDVKRGPDGGLHVEHRFPVEMSADIPDDAEARAILNRYLAHVGEEELLSQIPKRKTENGQAYAGSQKCQACHAAPHKVWAGSGHSHAWKTLVDVKHEKDPDCVGCHSVGLEYQSGFRSPAATPHLVNVGCENCHGPQGKHVADATKIRPPKVGAASCAQCHTPDQSPHFEFETFWKRIQH